MTMADSKEVKSSAKRKPPAAGMGRKPGSVNKTTAAVKETLMLAFDGVGGLPALIEWGRANPTPFYQTWAKLLPNEIKAELDKKLLEFASFNENIEEVFENREQIEISKYYEKLPKPSLVAIQEFLDDKIYYRNPAKEV